MSLKSKIGLGTVQFGLDYGISNKSGKTPEVEAIRILEFARSEGIDTVDTAIAYGDSEKVLGTFELNDFKVVSKYLPPSELKLTINEQLRQSLNNLGQKSIFGYLAHRPQDLLNKPSQWNELEEFKNQGLVQKIGFSLNTPRELEELLNVGYQPDIIQVPYNYFDRRFENLMKQLFIEGCEIHSRSSFLQGLFFRDPKTLSSHFNEVKGLLSEVRCSTNNIAGSLLNFVLEKSFVSRVIVGVDNKTQLKENIESLSNTYFLKDIDFELPDSILNPSNWPKK